MRFFSGKSVILLGKDFVATGKKRGKNLMLKRIEIPVVQELSPFSTVINRDAFLQAWDELTKEISPGGNLVLLLPENSFMVTFLTLQQTPESTSERERMVYFYMKKRYQGRGEVAVASFYQGKGKFLVATTAKRTIEGFKDVFSRVKLKLKSIKPASISAFNYLFSLKGGGDFTFMIFLDGFAVFMGVKEGCLEVYRRLRPPFSQEEIREELRAIDAFLGMGTPKVSCQGFPELEGVEVLPHPCWKLPLLGELG